MDDSLIYEHPLNEHIRTYLRLETLFLRFTKLCSLNEPEANHMALLTLFELLDLLDRGDAKAELMKDLENRLSHFQALSNNPQVDQSRLTHFITQLEKLLRWSQQYPGRFGAQLRNNVFISNTKHRSAIPGGSCCFDLPDLHFFKTRDPSTQHQLLMEWFDSLKGLKTSVDVLLRLLRETSVFQPLEVEKGLYQRQQLHPRLQLVRIKVDAQDDAFPEVSAGRHRMSLRMMKMLPSGERRPVSDTRSIAVAWCA